MVWRWRLVLSYNDARAYRHPRVKIDYVVVNQAEAARWNSVANGLRRIRAVNAVDGSSKVHCTSTQWIARSAGHESRQIGLPRNHLGRRMPIRPLGLVRYFQKALPSEALAANAYAVAQGAGFVLNQVQVPL